MPELEQRAAAIRAELKRLRDELPTTQFIVASARLLAELKSLENRRPRQAIT